MQLRGHQAYESGVRSLSYCPACVIRETSRPRWYSRTANAGVVRLACAAHRRWLVFMAEPPQTARQMRIVERRGDSDAWHLAELWCGALSSGKVSKYDRIHTALLRPQNFELLEDVRWQLHTAGWPVAYRVQPWMLGGLFSQTDPVRRTLVLVSIAIADCCIELVGRERLREACLAPL